MILGYNWFLSNPRGWIMSEKLNGVRGKWDGARLLHRNGKSNEWVFTDAPASVSAHFPEGVPLEFEIWHGRGGYRETMKLFQKNDKAALWASARFGVFDAPDHVGTIEERAEFIASLGLREPLFALNQVRCTGIAHLKRAFEDVFYNGGEGLVIRKPKSVYTNGRTTSLLKVKTPWF